MQINAQALPPEQYGREVRIVLDYLDEYRPVHPECQVIGRKLGIGGESLRNKPGPFLRKLISTIDDVESATI